MSLANKWADGEDSIAAPRSCRRSAEHDIDAKDQFHPGSQKKGHQNCYDDMENTDMVVAGYVHEDRDDNRDEETITMAAAAEVPVVTRSQVRSGVGDSHNYWQRRCLIADAQGIRASTRTKYEDLRTSSSSVENSFVSTGHFKRGWAPSS
jgi:hypothetical protein